MSVSSKKANLQNALKGLLGIGMYKYALQKQTTVGKALA